MYVYRTIKYLHIRSFIFLFSLRLDAEELSRGNNDRSLNQSLFEETYVVAEFQESRQQKTALSVSHIDGNRLAEQSIESLGDISNTVPSFQVLNLGVSNQISIRGISSGDNKGFEQAVGLYLDNVHISRDQLSVLLMVDLQQIDIVRGPQPTVFGKNTIAGAVNITTAKPTETFYSHFIALYEPEHGEHQAQAAISGPISESFAARVSVFTRDIDGYFYNTTSARDELKEQHHYVRGALRWDVHENFYNDLVIGFSDIDGQGSHFENHSPIGGFSQVFTGPLAIETETDYRNEGGDASADKQLMHSAMSTNYMRGDISFMTTTSLVSYDTDELFDIDYSPLDMLDGSNQQETYEQYAQEFRITSSQNEPFHYVAGLYWQKSQLRIRDEIRFNSFFASVPPLAFISDSSVSRDYQEDVEFWSVYSQFTLPLSSNVSLVLGGRYSEEHKDGNKNVDIAGGATNVASSLPSPDPRFNNALDFVFSNLNIHTHHISDSRKEHNFSPLIRLEWSMFNNLLWYASFTQGQKAGGFDIRSNSIAESPVPHPGDFTFDEEEGAGVEFGFKRRGEHALLNAAFFRTEYSNLQQTIYDGVLNFNVQNAAESHIQGMEFDWKWFLNEHWQFSGAAAYLDFEFDEFEFGQCYFGRTPDVVVDGEMRLCDFSGGSKNHVPKLTANLGLESKHRISSTLFLKTRLEAQYSSSYYTSTNLDPNLRQSAFTKWHLRLALNDQNDKWELALIGRNIGNQRVLLYGDQLPLAAALTGGTGTAYFGNFGRPRHLALQFRSKF